MSTTPDGICEEVLESFVNTGRWPKQNEFRAHRAVLIPMIDKLVVEGKVLRENGSYQLSFNQMRKSKLWPRESRITNSVLRIFAEIYRARLNESWTFDEVWARCSGLGISEADMLRTLEYLHNAGFINRSTDHHGKINSIYINEDVLTHPNLESKAKKFARNPPTNLKSLFSQEGLALSQTAGSAIQFDELNLWREIESEYGYSRRTFSKKIGFIRQPYRRLAILRDVAQAYGCLKVCFYKPSVVLCGGVIEEILRSYLIHKNIKPKSNRFEDYISACVDHSLLPKAPTNLSSSVREYRNSIHLERELARQDAIDVSKAKSTFANVFNVISELKRDK